MMMTMMMMSKYSLSVKRRKRDDSREIQIVESTKRDRKKVFWRFLSCCEHIIRSAGWTCTAVEMVRVGYERRGRNDGNVVWYYHVNRVYIYMSDLISPGS